MSHHEAAKLLDRIRDAGLRVTRFDSETIAVAPRDRLTPELAEAIRENKAALIEELRLQIGEEIIRAFLADLDREEAAGG